jgi:hypothetical protein
MDTLFTIAKLAIGMRSRAEFLYEAPANRDASQRRLLRGSPILDGFFGGYHWIGSLAAVVLELFVTLRTRLSLASWKVPPGSAFSVVDFKLKQSSSGANHSVHLLSLNSYWETVVV